MLLLAWFVVRGFSGCEPGSVLCLGAYWITQSGGWLGSFIIVAIISVAYAFIPLHPRAKIVMFIRTLLTLIIILGAFAKLNESLIKSRFAVSRPSHMLILKTTKSRVSLDSIYQLVVPERRVFFQKVIDSDTVSFNRIDKRVLGHWIYEVGYSMPSGHTFNAFLLASMLAFSLFELNNRRIGWWLYISMFWAAAVGLSRIILGVHTPLDVTIGAALGLLISHVLLAIPAMNRLLVPTQSRKASAHQK